MMRLGRPPSTPRLRAAGWSSAPVADAADDHVGRLTRLLRVGRQGVEVDGDVARRAPQRPERTCAAGFAASRRDVGVYGVAGALPPRATWPRAARQAGAERRHRRRDVAEVLSMRPLTVAKCSRCLVCSAMAFWSSVCSTVPGAYEPRALYSSVRRSVFSFATGSARAAGMICCSVGVEQGLAGPPRRPSR